jgi:hypothetical protein
MDHNPFLKKTGTARGGVEKLQNVEWQTRAAPPTEFENRLGDALEEIFARGIEQLSDVVAELNQLAIRDRHAKSWTEESFQAEMKRLGA